MLFSNTDSDEAEGEYEEEADQAVEIWTKEEDVTLLKSHASFGNQWSKISIIMNNGESSSKTPRTARDIKSRFRSLARARHRFWIPEEDQLLLKARDELKMPFEQMIPLFYHRKLYTLQERYKKLRKLKDSSSSEVPEGEFGEGSPFQSFAHYASPAFADIDQKKIKLAAPYVIQSPPIA